MRHKLISSYRETTASGLLKQEKNLSLLGWLLEIYDVVHPLQKKMGYVC